MPEEKNAYTEPIEGSAAKERHVLEGMSGNTLENIGTPEFSAEKVTDVKSESEILYQRILTALPSTGAHDDAIHQDADKVALQTDADSKVAQLVDLAVAKGVVHAVKVARRLNDFYVLDQMHDDLANKFYESLKQNGLIAE
ncbi:MAG: hypothetical protein PHT88_02415 [Candidatus Moranbacteria bacterium]|nr:hypothetical protein [Candidatus Moranbacteria bacterium]